MNSSGWVSGVNPAGGWQCGFGIQVFEVRRGSKKNRKGSQKGRSEEAADAGKNPSSKKIALPAYAVWAQAEEVRAGGGAFSASRRTLMAALVRPLHSAAVAGGPKCQPHG